MNKLVRRSLEILGKSVKEVGQDYTSNLTSFINDAKTVRDSLQKTGTDVSDTIAKLKTTDITKKISDWFYQEENSYDASQGDEFDAGFSVNSSDDTKLDGEKKPRQLDFEAMTEVAEKQSNTFLKIGRRQTEQSVANTAEIISVVNSRTSEMTTAINNINKTLAGISDRLDKIIELQAVPLTTEQQEIDKKSLYSNGKLSLANIFEQTKGQLDNNQYFSLAKMGYDMLFGQKSSPEELLATGLGFLTDKKLGVLGDKSISELGNKFNDMIGTAIQTGLGELINSKQFKGFFGDITSFTGDKDYGEIVKTSYDKKKAVFDGMTRYSIINVIPEMLAKINESISGVEYHLDNNGSWQKGPVRNDFNAIAGVATQNSGLSQRIFGKISAKAESVTGQSVPSQDIELASRALTGAIVYWMHYEGTRSFTQSNLKNMDQYIENACRILCTIKNDPLYWSQICQSICIQLSSGMMDSAEFIRNVNQSLENMQKQAIDFAQSGKMNAKQASKISLEMIGAELYKQEASKYSNPTPPTINGGSSSDIINNNNDGRIQKNDNDEWTVGKFTTAEYVRSIFGILNRGINVKVVDDNHKGYDKYNIRTDDPENPKSSDEKFAKLFMQMGGIGSGENAKDFKGIIKQGMNDALSDLTGGNAGDIRQAAGSLGGLITGQGGFMANMMGILGASSIRSLASKAVHGTLISDIKGLFGEGGKLREMGNNLKDRALGLRDQAMDHLPASMRYDRRTRQISDAVVGEDGIVRNGIDRAREGLSSGLNNARERVSDFLDNHQSIGRPLRRARDTVDAIRNNQLYQHESRVLRDSEDTLNNIDTDTIENFEDRMAAEAALMYFKRGDLENAKIEASKIENEELRTHILDKLKDIDEINKKREKGQEALANGETPEVGSVIQDMPSSQPISDEEAQKKGGLIGVVARGFGKTIKSFAKITTKIMAAIAKASAKLISSGTADLLVGLKNMGSGIKGIHQFNKELIGKAKNAIKTQTDKVKITRDRENNVDKTLTDLLKHPAKTVGNCFKNVATDIKNSKLGEGVKKLGESFKDSKLGEALDKLKKKITGVNDTETGENTPGIGERLGQRFRNTAFGSGFMQAWDESRAAKQKMDEVKERTSSFINRTAGSILDVLTGKEAIGEHSPFQEICDIITGIRDDMNANHEEDVENAEENDESSTENDADTTGTADDIISEITSGSTGAEGAAGAAEGAVNAAGATGGAASGAAGAAGAAGGAAGGAAAGGITGLLGNIGKLLGGMSLSIIGIAKIALGIVLGMEGVQAIVNTVQEVLQAILKPVNKIFVTIKKFIDTLIEPIQKALTTIVKSIVTIVSQLLDAIKPILELVGDILDKVLNEALMPLIGMVLDIMIKILMPIMDSLINILTPCVEAIGGVVETISGVLQVGMGIIIGMLGFIMKGFGWLVGCFSWVPGIGGDLGEKGDQIQTAGDNMLETAKALIGTGFEQMKHGLETFASSAIRAVQAIVPGGKDGTEGKEDKKDTGADTDQINVGTDFGAGNVNTNTVNNSWSYTYGSGNTTMNQHSYGNYMNMSERGCGPVALADAYNRRNGGHMNPATLASSMAGRGTYEPSRGTSVQSMVATGNSLGMGTRLGGVTQASLRHASPTNPITVLGSGAGFGTKAGNSHYVNVVGTDRHGGAYVSNPMSGRVERQSLSQIALNSKLGLYGSGDIDLDEYGIDEDTSESLKKLKELTGKLTTMFTGSSSDDIDAMAKYNEYKAKAQRIQNEIGEEAYNKLVEEGMQAMREKYPQKDGESDEDYEKRIAKKWEKYQYQYIVEHGSETAVNNIKKLKNSIIDAAAQTIANHNANVEAVRNINVSGNSGSENIYAYMSEFSPILYYENDVEGVTSGKTPVHNYFAATSGSALKKDDELVSMMTINGGWYGHSDNPDKNGVGSEGEETSGIKISHSSKERMMVRAITPGTVVAVTDDDEYGKSVKFKDAAGTYHWYMNLASIADGIEPNANLSENADIGVLGYDDGKTDYTLQKNFTDKAVEVATQVGEAIASALTGKETETEKIKETAEKDNKVQSTVNDAAKTMMNTATGAIGPADEETTAAAAKSIVNASVGLLEADPKKRQQLQYIVTSKENSHPGDPSGTYNPFAYWEFVDEDAESSTNLVGDTEKEQIFNYLVNNIGFSEEQAAGIMGVWNRESSNKAKTLEGYYAFDASKVEAAPKSNESLDAYTLNDLFPMYDRSGVNYGRSGYQGSDSHWYPGFGLAQWTGPRGKQVLDYAKSRNNDWTETGTQMAFVGDEMNGDYSYIKKNILATNTVKGAADVWMSQYEAGYANTTDPYSTWLGSSQIEGRRSDAEAIYKELKGTSKNKKASGSSSSSSSSSKVNSSSTTVSTTASTAGTGSYGTVITQSTPLNMRSGPGTSYTLITTIPKGATVEILGESDDKMWYYVSYNGKKGYVSKEYISPSAGPSSSVNSSSSVAASGGNTGTVNTKETALNMRTGPGLENGVIAQLAKGSSIQILGESDDKQWYYVTDGTNVGYVKKEYVIAYDNTGTPTPEITPASEVVTTSTTNIPEKRKGRFRSTVFIKGKGGSGSGNGYFTSDEGVALANYGTPNITKTNITDSTSGESPIHDFFGVMNNSEAYSANGNWYTLRNDPNSEGVGSSGGEHGGVDILWKDGSEGKGAYATTGGTVDWVAGGGGYNGGVGNSIRWIDSANNIHWYCHFKDDPLFDVGDTIQPGDLLGYAGNTGDSYGAHLHYSICDDEGFTGYTGSPGWNPLMYFSNYNENGGSSSTVSSGSTGGSSSSSSSSGGSSTNDMAGTTGTVTTQSTALNMRDKPNTSGKIITTIPKGATVKILSDEGDWYYVSYNGKTGYVSKDYITISSSSGSKGYSTGSSSAYSESQSKAHAKHNVPSDYMNYAHFWDDRNDYYYDYYGNKEGRIDAYGWLARHHSLYADSNSNKYVGGYAKTYGKATMSQKSANSNQYWSLLIQQAQKKKSPSKAYNDQGQSLDDHFMKLKSAWSTKGGGDVGDDYGYGLDANDFWYNELFNQDDGQIITDIPDLDPNDFKADSTQYDGFGTLNNFVQKYEIKSDPSVNINMLDKMSKMTFNVRAERVEELLEELIKKVSGEEPTPSTSGTDTNLFKNDQIPAQITRLSRG